MARIRRDDTYRWDVFISYPRRPGIWRWVAEILHPQLDEELQQVGLGRPVKLFRDESDIEPGDDWPQKLSEEHVRSRVVLPVLCFPFFESRWCCSEWKTAVARAQSRRGRSIVVPVRFNDLESDTIDRLPQPWRDEVARKQVLDLRKYSTLVNRLSDTELGHGFRREIADLCAGPLKTAILSAPQYSNRWPRVPTDPFIRSRPAFRARLGNR